MNQELILYKFAQYNCYSTKDECDNAYSSSECSLVSSLGQYCALT